MNIEFPQPMAISRDSFYEAGMRDTNPDCPQFELPR